jgi:hypothetical protein
LIYLVIVADNWNFWWIFREFDWFRKNINRARGSSVGLRGFNEFISRSRHLGCPNYGQDGDLRLSSDT